MLHENSSSKWQRRVVGKLSRSDVLFKAMLESQTVLEYEDVIVMSADNNLKFIITVKALLWEKRHKINCRSG